MIPLQVHHLPTPFLISQTTPLRSFSPTSETVKFSPKPSPFSSSPILLSKPPCKFLRAAGIQTSALCRNEEESTEISIDLEDLSPDGVVYKKTLALVECSMFVALTGLAFFLSNSLAIECTRVGLCKNFAVIICDVIGKRLLVMEDVMDYFGCFFSLLIVITSMRRGIATGRKTVVATTMLLLVLSGPVKALTYLLKHGLVGFAMGSLWRFGANWSLSIFLCTIVRSLGVVGYVLISSFLINHYKHSCSLTFIFTASGIYSVPSMEAIYALFGTLVLINIRSFMFLLHLLCSVFLTRLRMKASLRLPRWLEKAI